MLSVLSAPVLDGLNILTEQVLVFQKPDGSGEQANGTAGTPLGQGLHVENDPDDRPVCDYFISQDAAFVH
jgi:hypothetical protein